MALTYYACAMNGSFSSSYTVDLLSLSALPITETELKLIAAAASIGLNKIPIIASFVETRFGAVNKPTAHVKITKDITLGFINLNNSDKLNKSS